MSIRIFETTNRPRAYFAGLIAFLASASFTLNSASADWNVCNRTAEKVSIVIAYIGHDGGFVSRGWWVLQSCGGCAKVLLKSEAGGFNDGFLHSQTTGGVNLIQGDSTFCAPNSSFQMNGKTANCPATKQFRRLQIDLNKNWTTNITGKATSGAVCID